MNWHIPCSCAFAHQDRPGANNNKGLFHEYTEHPPGFDRCRSHGQFPRLDRSSAYPGASLAAIADPTPGQAARLAAELGVSKVYTDPQQLLDDPDIDGVLIAALPAATPSW